jgi:hypothetical protein
MQNKRISPINFAICIFFFTLASCKNSSNHSLKIGSANNDSVPSDYIKGKVLFRIKGSDFFEDNKKRGVASLEKSSKYLPVSFYVYKGHFFIPNRLSDEIYEITSTGHILRKIVLPIDFDIAMFFISPDGYKYIIDNERGMVAFDNEDNMLFKNDSISFLIPSLQKNNALIIKKSEPVTKISYPDWEITFTMSDIQGAMKKPYVLERGYFEYCFGNDFFYELDYNGLPEIFTKEDSLRGFERNMIKFRKHNLRSGKLVSERAIKINCKHCFNLPKFLSEKIVVSSNYDDKKNEINELLLLTENGYRTFILSSEIDVEAGLISNDYGLMNRGYIYSYDSEQNKLYSVVSTKGEVIVMEYNIPENTGK